MSMYAETGSLGTWGTIAQSIEVGDTLVTLSASNSIAEEDRELYIGKTLVVTTSSKEELQSEKKTIVDIVENGTVLLVDSPF